MPVASTNPIDHAALTSHHETTRAFKDEVRKDSFAHFALEFIMVACECPTGSAFVVTADLLLVLEALNHLLQNLSSLSFVDMLIHLVPGGAMDIIIKPMFKAEWTTTGLPSRETFVAELIPATTTSISLCWAKRVRDNLPTCHVVATTIELDHYPTLRASLPTDCFRECQQLLERFVGGALMIRLSKCFANSVRSFAALRTLCSLSFDCPGRDEGRTGRIRAVETVSSGKLCACSAERDELWVIEQTHGKASRENVSTASWREQLLVVGRQEE